MVMDDIHYAPVHVCTSVCNKRKVRSMDRDMDTNMVTGYFQFRCASDFTIVKLCVGHWSKYRHILA